MTPNEMLSMIAQLRRERDEAKEAYDTLATEHVLAVNKLAEERDEAREALKKCREDSICYAEHMRRCGYAGAYKESKENAERAERILKAAK